MSMDDPRLLTRDALAMMREVAQWEVRNLEDQLGVANARIQLRLLDHIDALTIRPSHAAGSVQEDQEGR